jgi:L-asparaginase
VRYKRSVASRVLLLATKDTIAYGERGGRPAIATGAELLATVPAAGRPADVTVEDVMTEPGWDISAATMLMLARRVRAAVLDEGFDGVVVTHGTDTVEQTAYLTDLLAGPAATRAGIVFTGAVRRLDAPDTDGPGNLADALTAAVDPVVRQAGTVGCFGGELHAARWITQVDAADAAGFSSRPHPVVGRVRDGRVEPVGTPPPRPPDPPGQPESDVALIRTYPDMPSTLLTAAVDAGAAGIVLEGTGGGNVPVGLFATISDLTEWGIPVVVASRAAHGDGALPDLDTGMGLAAKVGAIGSRGLAATKARVALMVALGTGNADAARAWFSRL